MALVLIVSIIVSEVLIMFIIQRWQIKWLWVEALIDSFLLAFLIFPAIYFLVIRPLAIQTTRRKHAEVARQYSLSIMEATIESIHNGILVISSQGKVIRTNAKFAEMWRIPADIIALGEDKTLLDYVFGQLSDPNGFIAKVTELYEKPEAESLDVINLTDGRIFKRISKPMYLGGEPKGRVWSFLDITERVKAEAALLKSEARLQTLLHAIPDLIWLKDLNGVYLSCNAMFERLIGLKEDEITGKTDDDFFDRELAEFYQQNDRNAFAAGKSVSNEEWLTFADNGYHALIDVIKTPMYDSAGTFIGILGIGRDITERRNVENQIIQKNQLLNAVLESSPEIIVFALDREYRYLTFNLKHKEVIQQIWGKEIAIGASMLDIIGDHKDRDTAKANFDRALAGESFVLSEEYGDENLSRLYWLDYWSPIHDGIGNIIGLTCFVLNITERKRAELEVSLINQKLEAIISASPDGIGMISLDGKLQLLSDKLLEMYKYTIEEKDKLIGRTIYDFIDPTSHKILFDNLNKLLAGESDHKITEYLALRNDNSRFYVDVNSSLLFDFEGNPSNILFIERDITERKQIENDIILKNEELQKNNAEKDKFFSIIAHDLRSPFSSFLGLTQIMAEDLPSLTMAEVQDLAITMKNSATNLYSLLENLLQWARMQQGSISFTPEVLSLISVVGECLAISSETAKNKNIELFNDIQDIKVFADSNALQTIIRNLVSNAMKFTPSNGKISVSDKIASDKSVEISVKDTGIGMSAELVDNLFRPDVQTSRKGTDGEPSSGLGLMLCKEFIEKQGGKIWVESEVGKGSTFYFTIPGVN